MLTIPGFAGRDNCDGTVNRRDLLRFGGLSLAGLSLGNVLTGEAHAVDKPTEGGQGFGKAKNVILIYLQGGPSHLDLWDPKENVPDNMKSNFKPIGTKLPGVQVTELLPKIADVLDKTTLIRSMSYTPNGLFNHTAAIYQMLTGYTTDKVSPSGQLEPPNAKDFPTLGSNIVKFKPATVPMLPFVMMPRPLQESNVVGKGGTAGFLGKAYDPYLLYPPGDDMDMNKMSRISVDDLLLREELSKVRMERRATLRETVAKGMPELERAVGKFELDSYYDKALGLILSGRAREAFDLEKGVRQGPDALRQEHLRPVLPARPATRRSGDAVRRDQLAQGGQLRQPLVGRAPGPVEADERPGRPDARHWRLGPDRRPRSTRHARRHAGDRRWRIRPQPTPRRQHVRQQQL